MYDAKRTRGLGLVAAGLLVLAAGCSAHNDATPVSCGVPGLLQSCTCPSGPGTQTCQADGTWQLCQCADAGHVGSAGSGGQNGASGSNGAGQAGSTSAGSGGSTSTTTDAGGGSGGAGGTSGQLDGGPRDGAAGSAGSDASAPSTTLYTKCQSVGQCGKDEACFKASAGGGILGGSGGYCTKPCTKASDCPAPSTGNATPTCLNQLCALDCGSGPFSGITCPTGLSCLQLSVSSTRNCY